MSNTFPDTFYAEMYQEGCIRSFRDTFEASMLEKCIKNTVHEHRMIHFPLLNSLRWCANHVPHVAALHPAPGTETLDRAITAQFGAMTRTPTSGGDE